MTGSLRCAVFCRPSQTNPLSRPTTLSSSAHPRAQEADEDGSGELDIDEFCDKLGPYLGDVAGHQLRTRDDIRHLFMKIDADAGGTVDWWVAGGRRGVDEQGCAAAGGGRRGVQGGAVEWPVRRRQ
jgi:hypothetical protein